MEASVCWAAKEQRERRPREQQVAELHWRAEARDASRLSGYTRANRHNEFGPDDNASAQARSLPLVRDRGCWNRRLQVGRRRECVRPVASLARVLAQTSAATEREATQTDREERPHSWPPLASRSLIVGHERASEREEENSCKFQLQFKFKLEFSFSKKVHSFHWDVRSVVAGQNYYHSLHSWPRWLASRGSRPSRMASKQRQQWELSSNESKWPIHKRAGERASGKTTRRPKEDGGALISRLSAPPPLEFVVRLSGDRPLKASKVSWCFWLAHPVALMASFVRARTRIVCASVGGRWHLAARLSRKHNGER